jgi:Flp pilus assembly protein TadD
MAVISADTDTKSPFYNEWETVSGTVQHSRSMANPASVRVKRDKGNGTYQVIEMTIDPKTNNPIEKLILEGNFEGAIELADSALEENPDDAHARFLKASLLFDLEDYEGSLEQYDILLKNHPNNPTYLNNKACTLMALGRADEAHEYFLKALENDPDSAIINGNVAVSYGAKGDFEQSLTYAERALQLNPNDCQRASIEHTRALAMMKLGKNPEEAVEAYLKDAPEETRRQWLKIVAQEGNGFHPDTIAYVRKLAQEAPAAEIAVADTALTRA